MNINNSFYQRNKNQEFFLIDSLIIDIMNLITSLEGKKTYLVALAFALVAFAQGLGWIDSGMADFLYKLLGATGLATMAAKVNRVIK